MKTISIQPKNDRSPGFTLLELLVAMVVLVVAMSLIFQVFSGTISSWKRGTEVIDGVKHGDYAMNQLASALNSTVYFYNERQSYGFTIEKGNTSGLPADTLMFVTASSAFMPESSPLRDGPHRIKIFIDMDENGDPALFTQAIPALADFDDFEAEFNTEPHLVSRNVQGLEIMVYNEDTDDWTVEWEKKNSVPERVKVMVYVPSDDEYEEPLVFTRVLEIPVAQSVKHKLAGPSKRDPAGTGGNTSGGNVPGKSGGTSPGGGGSINIAPPSKR